jgi:ferricrocin synthase
VIPLDAWSLRLLAQDLELLYLGQKPRANNAYREFLHNVMADPNRLDIQRTYWQSVFHDFGKPALFPLLNDSPPGKGNQSRRLNCIFREVLRDVDELERRSKALRLPLHTMLLTCWADVQRRWSHWSSRVTNDSTNKSEVIFGLWHAGRSMDSPSADLEMDNLAIPTINILPVRVSFSSLDESNGARGLVASAKRLRVDLQRRTPLIEQTRWTDVTNWIQGASTDEQEHAKPICNVFVNVLKVPTPGGLGDNDLHTKETESSTRTTRLFKFIKVWPPH